MLAHLKAHRRLTHAQRRFKARVPRRLLAEARKLAHREIELAAANFLKSLDKPD